MDLKSEEIVWERRKVGPPSSNSILSRRSDRKGQWRREYAEPEAKLARAHYKGSPHSQRGNETKALFAIERP